MTTILSTFALSFVIALLITPLAGKLGERIGAIDLPGERKVHLIPIPRSGGIAIILSFFAALAMSKLLMTQISEQLVLDTRTVMFITGACVIFGVGLIDDIYRLNHKIKFLAQIISASIAFFGGMRVTSLFYGELTAQSFIISYCLTVFWFLLVINAVNLIDGLDGLAAGICFFTSTVLTFFLFRHRMHLMAMLFTALAGSVLGFLRYNFNPARIFMGDSGSYFLGYSIAALSIMGAIKSQAGIIMMIPLLAMGVPLFDTILSPVRRFLLGKKMFQPDKSHVHHRLLASGLSSKNAVFLIYACSIILCLIALVLANFHDRRTGIFLVVLAIVSVVFIRKLGYLEYIASDKIFGWFKDMSDVSGISRDRRSFLNLQIEITNSKDVKELWDNICIALEMVEFDSAELVLNRGEERTRRQWSRGGEGKSNLEFRIENLELQKIEEGRTENEKLGSWEDAKIGDSVERRVWRREQGVEDRKAEGTKLGRYEVGKESGELNDVHTSHLTPHTSHFTSLSSSLFKVELPLMNGSGESFGTLLIAKDLQKGQLNSYTIRRVEHLRRAVLSALENLEKKEKDKRTEI